MTALTYLQLKKKIEEQDETIRKLQNEISKLNENTIITSMNDMKDMYIQKEYENNLVEIQLTAQESVNYKLIDTLKALKLMVSSIIQNLSIIQIPHRFSYEEDTKIHLYKLECNLCFLLSIINESIRSTF